MWKAYTYAAAHIIALKQKEMKKKLINNLFKDFNILNC